MKRKYLTSLLDDAAAAEGDGRTGGRGGGEGLLRYLTLHPPFFSI